jgi:hypothetical protein
MGTIKNGKSNGKTGKIVTYELLGRTVTRTVGKNSNPPTEAQLASREGVKIGNKFMEPIKAFIKVSLKTVAAKYQMYPHNRMMSNIKLNALQGTYPELSINYSNLLLAEGNLPMAENPKVEKTDNGLKFTWDKVKAFPRNTDQVMLMAYFSELNKAIFVTAGAKRSSGEDILEIKSPLINEKMEVYIAFIAEDRNGVSNSTYLGQL